MEGVWTYLIFHVFDEFKGTLDVKCHISNDYVMAYQTE